MMELQYEESLFAKGSKILPSWAMHWPTPVKETDEQPGQIQVLLMQVLENQQRLWEVNQCLEEYLLEVAEQQRYLVWIQRGERGEKAVRVGDKVWRQKARSRHCYLCDQLSHLQRGCSN